CFFFFSSRRRHTISLRDWSSDVCSSDLGARQAPPRSPLRLGSVSVIDDVAEPAGVAAEAQWTSRRSLSSASRAVCCARKRLFMRSEERRVGKECRSGSVARHSTIRQVHG